MVPFLKSLLGKINGKSIRAANTQSGRLTARNKIRDIILVSGLGPLDNYPTIICSINLIINFDGPGLRDTGRFCWNFGCDQTHL
jgi:hypothetical protein